MEALTGQVQQLLCKVKLTEDRSKVVTILVCVWTNQKGLFSTFVVSQKNPSVYHVFLFQYARHKDTLSFQRVGVVQFVKDLRSD